MTTTCVNHPDRTTDLTCSQCGAAVCGECAVTTQGTIYCDQCASVPAADPPSGTPQYLDSTLAADPPSGTPQYLDSTLAPVTASSPPTAMDSPIIHQVESPNYLGAAIVGAIVAAGGGWLWSVITENTDHKYGLVALLIGIGVGIAVLRGGGGRQGLGLQVLGGTLAAGGILFGELLIWKDALEHIAAAKGMTLPGGAWTYALHTFAQYIKSFNLMDWVFLAIGLYEGFVIPGQRPKRPAG